MSSTKKWEWTDWTTKPVQKQGRNIKPKFSMNVDISVFNVTQISLIISGCLSCLFGVPPKIRAPGVTKPRAMVRAMQMLYLADSTSEAGGMLW